jgi:hypothetical protein
MNSIMSSIPAGSYTLLSTGKIKKEQNLSAHKKLIYFIRRVKLHFG